MDQNYCRRCRRRTCVALRRLHPLIMVLVAVMVLDYVTGVADAAVTGTLSSAVGFKGLLKKIFILILVALAA